MRIISGIVLIAVIVGVIVFLENQKAAPGGFTTDFQAEQVDIASLDPEIPEEKRIIEKSKKYSLSPELAGISGYINSEEIKISDFRGKVVLIDFWTYTCINCIRTLPYITEWDRKYEDKGLVIIGVHTPEFNFEKVRENVESAMEKHGIEYIVVQDNDYATWSNFQNRYWPRKYLIDGDGFIRYDHIGEGGYEETEEMIQTLLEEIGEQVDEEISTALPSLRTRTTPELYAGYDFNLKRGQDIGNDGGLEPETSKFYTRPVKLPSDEIVLEGRWKSNSDSLELESEGTIILDFTAASVNIVAERMDLPVEVDVSINGEPVSANQAGSDVIVEEDRSYFVVDDPQLYNIVSNGHGNFLLELKSSHGFAFNAFTFG